MGTKKMQGPIRGKKRWQARIRAKRKAALRQHMTCVISRVAKCVLAKCVSLTDSTTTMNDKIMQGSRSMLLCMTLMRCENAWSQRDLPVVTGATQHAAPEPLYAAATHGKRRLHERRTIS